MLVKCIDGSDGDDFRACMIKCPTQGELYYVRSTNGRIKWQRQPSGLYVVDWNGYLLEEIHNPPCACTGGHEPAFFARRFVPPRFNLSKLLTDIPVPKEPAPLTPKPKVPEYT